MTMKRMGMMVTTMGLEALATAAAGTLRLVVCQCIGDDRVVSCPNRFPYTGRDQVPLFQKRFRCVEAIARRDLAVESILDNFCHCTGP